MNTSLIPLGYDLSTDLLEEIKAYALCTPHLETCGFVVRKLNRQIVFLPAENIADDKENEFAISAYDYVRADETGDILYVFHSHTRPVSFSMADKASCKRWGIPWLLYREASFEVLQPSNEPIALLGRPWVWGLFDCYSLIRDGLESHLGLKLKDYARPPLYDIKGECPWTRDPEWNMYEIYFEVENFVVVSSPRKYDVLLMTLQSRFGHANHAALYMDEGKNTFYHHLLDKVSCEDIYGGYWQRNTKLIVRHKSLC